jgi:PIN domain nuclease of toxin-antitoxin system
MNYLIDTQILIWYQLNSEKLSSSIYALLNNSGNVIYVSPVSFFEIAIKQKIGKIPEFDLSVAELNDLVVQDGFTLLDLRIQHIAAYADVPLLTEHRDPFDRLLLATALSENIPIISADQNFARYQPRIQLIVN